MTRVSQLELYNDKDIITQICMMKQMVETGTYAEVRITEDSGNYVFEFEDQNGDVQTFTVPAKQISGVTSSQSGSTVTMRITYTDSSYTDVSWTAGGDVTTNTNQTISAVKTFSVSPIIPDTPSGTHAAVNLTYVSKTDGTNNLLHTADNEDATGYKNFKTECDVMKYRHLIVSANTGSAGSQWVKVVSFTPNSNYPVEITIESGRSDSRFFRYDLQLYGTLASHSLNILHAAAASYTPSGNDVAVVNESDGKVTIYFDNSLPQSYDGVTARLDRHNIGTSSPYTLSDVTYYYQDYADPTTDPTVQYGAKREVNIL